MPKPLMLVLEEKRKEAEDEQLLRFQELAERYSAEEVAARKNAENMYTRKEMADQAEVGVRQYANYLVKPHRVPPDNLERMAALLPNYELPPNWRALLAKEAAAEEAAPVIGGRKRK